MAWCGYADGDTWELDRSLKRQGCEESVRNYWLRSGKNPGAEFYPDPDDKWRCYQCGKGYNSERCLKAHITRTHPKRQWRGTTADKDERNAQHKRSQREKEKVVCGKDELENVWTFPYLGSQFRADGDQMHDVKTRIAMAMQTAGKMRNIWSARTVPQSLKLRIYKSGVCSRLVYGSEGWRLTAQVQRMLNGANSRMVARITGKTQHEEASTATRTLDIIAQIRAVRLKWLGHILRMDQSRMVHRAVKHMFRNRREGDILMDAPEVETWQDPMKEASQRQQWRMRVQSIKKTGRAGDRKRRGMQAQCRNVCTMQTRSMTRVEATAKGARCESKAQVIRSSSSSNNVIGKNRSEKVDLARRYRERDAHEQFFRSKSRVAFKRTVTKKRKSGKKALDFKRSLTDKERAAAAREHWEL